MIQRVIIINKIKFQMIVDVSGVVRAHTVNGQFAARISERKSETVWRTSQNV